MKRTFCYLSDATIAYFLVMLQGLTREAYNVGGDERFEISVLLLAQMLAEKYHLNVIRKSSNELAAFQQRVPDISKVRALGWEPAISIPEGFRNGGEFPIRYFISLKDELIGRVNNVFKSY